MHIATALAQIPPCSGFVGVTIGMFDGVHVGHQKLLQHLRAKVGARGTVAALTFSNHPSTVFTPKRPVKLICSLEERLQRLEKAGVDIAIVLPFTQEFSQMPYDLFLTSLRSHLPFSYLLLGCGACLGKERKGDAIHVKKLGEKEGFEVEYLDKVSGVSSGQIRLALERGDIKAAQEMLGTI